MTSPTAPVVGIAGAITRLTSDDAWQGYTRTFANTDGASALRTAGAVPVVLPVMPDVTDAAELTTIAATQVERVDGLLLPGGEDIDPVHFGQEPHALLGRLEPERDAWDLALYSAARARGIPVLGICRGMQLIVVAEGGTLWQDNSLAPQPPSRTHMQCDESRDLHALWHTAHIEPGTRLARMLADHSTGDPAALHINSFHHQSADQVPPTLRIDARSDDGLVEGVEASDPTAWVLGVQWHPERTYRTDPASLAVFEAFVEACGEERLPGRGTTVRRQTGRVIPVDEHGRGLLMHGFEPDRPDWWFWFTIGGGVEPGETTRQAAARELFEETGIAVDEVALGEPFLREPTEFTWGGRTIINDQDLYAVRLPAGTVPVLPTLSGLEAETIDRVDWVSADDLESGVEEPVHPDLPRYVRLAAAAVGAPRARA